MQLLFFFNDTATTEIYTLSLHDALPISLSHAMFEEGAGEEAEALIADWLPSYDRSGILHGHIAWHAALSALERDRKSTRLNSSHANISYAVFCLKKKKQSH